MSPDRERIAQALLAQQAPLQQGATDPFMLNQGLESQAAGQRPPLHPLVQAIMQKLGFLNMVRNNGNQTIAGVQDVMNQDPIQ